MDKPASFLPLSPHQFHILLALTDAERHGYALIQDIHRRTGGDLRLGTGTLYTAIARLVELGLLVDTGRSDDRRRYYRLTTMGRAVLKAETGGKPVVLATSSPSAKGATRKWNRVEDFVQEVGDARVWAGIHFRFSTEQGQALGRKVAKYLVKHHLQRR